MKNMKIFETPNPYCPSETFIYGYIENVGYCFVKINNRNQIEETGINIVECMNNLSIGAILSKSKKPTAKRRHLFTSIGVQYWFNKQRNFFRLMNTKTYIENNSGTIII